MGSEIIAYHDHLVGIGITVSKQVLDLVRPVDGGALCGYLDCTPPYQRLGEQKHVGCPDPFIFVIVALWLARFGWQGCARFLDQLHRLFIHIHQRVPWIIGTLIEIEDIFHISHKVGTVLWRNHPTFV
jgi:hypothetical protein